MSDEAPLLELFERLAPNKNKKWAEWVQKLQGQDIDNEEDVLNLSEKAIDGLPITEPLKDVSLPQTSVRPGVVGKEGPLTALLQLLDPTSPSRDRDRQAAKRLRRCSSLPERTVSRAH
jgi:hypothetical protein